MLFWPAKRQFKDNLQEAGVLAFLFIFLVFCVLAFLIIFLVFCLLAFLFIYVFYRFFTFGHPPTKVFEFVKLILRP